MLKANVRLYGPVTGSTFDNSVDGIKLEVDHDLSGIHDADEVGDGRITAYVDLDHPDPEPTDNAYDFIQSSALDLTGTRADFEAFIADLRSFVAENWPEA